MLDESEVAKKISNMEENQKYLEKEVDMAIRDKKMRHDELSNLLIGSLSDLNVSIGRNFELASAFTARGHVYMLQRKVAIYI